MSSERMLCFFAFLTYSLGVLSVDASKHVSPIKHQERGSLDEERRILNQLLVRARSIAVRSILELQPYIKEIGNFVTNLKNFLKKLKNNGVSPKSPPFPSLTKETKKNLIKEAQTIVLESNRLLTKDNDTFLSLYKEARLWLEESLDAHGLSNRTQELIPLPEINSRMLPVARETPSQLIFSDKSGKSLNRKFGGNIYIPSDIIRKIGLNLIYLQIEDYSNVDSE